MIELPWPPAKLSPNGSHGHYHAHRRAAAIYRDQCSKFLSDQPVPRVFADRVMVELTYCPPTKRLCDLDNLLARTKHGIDALADAMGVNDQIFEYWLRRGEPVKHGKVVVRLHYDEPELAAVA